jgi:hypothetical protein
LFYLYFVAAQHLCPVCDEADVFLLLSLLLFTVMFAAMFTVT